MDYGQRHRRELERGGGNLRFGGRALPLCDLSGLGGLLAGSSLTSPEIEWRRAFIPRKA